MKRVLVIQTAFIGDVILATPVIEKLHQAYPQLIIDFMLRKGNEGLLEGHPFLNRVLIWDKKQGKYAQLRKLIGEIRAQQYDYVINLQRFFTTGLITVLSGGTKTIGFDKNPLSSFFSYRYPHIIDTEKGNIHEVDRNLSLLSRLTDVNERVNPRLYPRPNDFELVKHEGKYVTMSPTSVWFTKQYPLEKWVEVVNLVPSDFTVFLLGGKSDGEACEQIKAQTSHPNVVVKAGQLDFLASAALMKNAEMNYVNDSAPMHLASAVDAPVTAIFCSTVPAFGFGPLSSRSRVVEVNRILDCRPCGLHGYQACPKGHFNCSDISAKEIVGNL
ncbi:MAG: glycosyltransferase family 9 protein [Bacteroidota bacterium]|nr:glycosyltransferase family 9 protein [Bacteroidota bacterium]